MPSPAAAVGYAADGRRLLPALTGFTANDRYQTALVGGEAGIATGFGNVVFFQLGADMMTGTAALVGKNGQSGSSGVGGWANYASSTKFVWTVANAAGTPAFVDAPRRTALASDVGRLFLHAGLFDGSFNRQWVDRAEYLIGSAISSYTPPGAANAQRIGYDYNLPNPAVSSKPLASLCWRGVPTPAQMLDLYDRARLLGDLPTDFTLTSASSGDIDALAPLHRYKAGSNTLSGGNLATLPNLGSAGGALAVAAGALAAPVADGLFNGQPVIVFTGAQRLSSNLPASAFAFLSNGQPFDVLIVYAATSDTSQYLLATDPGAANTQLGLVLSRATGGAFRYFLGNGTANVFDLQAGSLAVNVPSYIQCTLGNSRAALSQGPYVAAQGGAAAANFVSGDPTGFSLGAGTGMGAPVIGKIAELVMFNRQLSPSELAKFHDYCRVTYGIGGVTVTHRWSLRDAMRAAATVPVAGQLAPASLADTTTAAANDAHARTGSPTIVTIDTSTDGRRFLSLLGFDASSGLATASGAGIGGATGGWWLADVETIYPGTTANRYLVWRASGSTGYSLDVNAAGTTLRLIVYDGAGAALTLTAALTTADHGRPMVIVLRHDGATMKVYLRRAEAASGALAGFTVSAAPMKIGLTGCESRHWHGLMGGNSVISVAQVNTIFDSFDATGRLQAITGYTDHYYDPAADILGASGAAPVQVLDRIGTDHATRQGTLYVSERRLKLWSYDSRPVLYGVGSRDADYYGSVGGGISGLASAWWYACPCMLISQAVPSATRVLAGKNDTGGWDIRASGANAALSAVISDGTAVFRSAPTIALSASDLWKWNLCVLWWDGSKIHLALRRVESGTGVSITGYTPPAASAPFRMGRHTSAFGLFAEGWLTFGGMGGNTLISVAEMQAACDAFAAYEDLVAIPGKTDFLVSHKLDALENGGVLPAVGKDRIGSANVTRNGAPTLAPVYSRALNW